MDARGTSSRGRLESVSRALHSLAYLRRSSAEQVLLASAKNHSTNWPDYMAPVRKTMELSANSEDSQSSVHIEVAPVLPSLDVVLQLAGRRLLDMAGASLTFGCMTDYILLRKWLFATGHSGVIILLEDLMLFRTLESFPTRLRIVSAHACHGCVPL
jgi:hypothetical protein